MLALIAGRGRLPEIIVAEATEPPLVVAMAGQEPESLAVDESFALETLGGLIARLKARGVTHLALAGAITRPGFDPSKLDAETKALLPILMQALGAGDDGALTAAMELFQNQGFIITGTREIVPHLFADAALASGIPVNDTMRADAEKGGAIIAALAPFDVGQACVVGQGQLLGLEGIGGTEWMLSTLPDTPLRARGVLVKRAKPGQDMRADVPTIGPDTITQAATAGLCAIVVEADMTLVLDRVQVMENCARHGIALWAQAF